MLSSMVCQLSTHTEHISNRMRCVLHRFLPAEVSSSPLSSVQAPQQQQQQGLACCGQGPAVPAVVRCTALLGLSVHACGSVLWLHQQGLVAHAAGSVLLLTDLASHQQRRLQHHSQPIGAAAASCDCQLLTTGSTGPEPGSGCAEVCVWELSSCTLRFVLCQHACGVSQLQFSPDGCWLVSVGGGTLVLWDLETGQAAAIGKTHKVRSGSCTPCCGCGSVSCGTPSPTFAQQGRCSGLHHMLQFVSWARQPKSPCLVLSSQQCCCFHAELGL